MSKKIEENQEENFEHDLYKFPTRKLPERYKVSKRLVYKRLGALHIKPIKEGKNSYITAEQLQLMDDLHAHLKAGRKTNEFVQQRIATGEIFLIQEAVPEAALVTQTQAQAMTVSQTQNLAATVESVEPLEDETIEGLLLKPVAPDIISVPDRDSYRTTAASIHTIPHPESHAASKRAAIADSASLRASKQECEPKHPVPAANQKGQAKAICSSSTIKFVLLTAMTTIAIINGLLPTSASAIIIIGMIAVLL